MASHLCGLISLFYLKLSLRNSNILSSLTTQKMKFSIKGFYSKCDQIHSLYGHIYWRNPSWKTSFLV